MKSYQLLIEESLEELSWNSVKAGVAQYKFGDISKKTVKSIKKKRLKYHAGKDIIMRDSGGCNGTFEIFKVLDYTPNGTFDIQVRKIGYFNEDDGYPVLFKNKKDIITFKTRDVGFSRVPVDVFKKIGDRA